MIKQLTTGWTLLKFVRVGLGLLILYSGIEAGSAGNIFFGSLFTLLGVFAPGTCCAGGTCEISPKPMSSRRIETESVKYEELDSK